MDQNKRKKNKKAGNFFNLTKASKAFKKFAEKYNKEESIKNAKRYYNKTDEFFLSLNKIFFKEEIKETDCDYILREIKNQIKTNQTLIDLYGINAQKKILPYTRDPVKYNKKLLFNPLKPTNEKPLKNLSVKNKNKAKKHATLPSILKSFSGAIPTRQNTEKMILSKLNRKFTISKSINNTKIKSSKKLNTFSKSYFDDNSISFNLNNEKISPIKKTCFKKTNKGILNLNIIETDISAFTLGTKPNKSFNKKKYLLTLDNLKDQARDKQKKQKKIFQVNDYGCEVFKNKYNYITKKMFN